MQQYNNSMYLVLFSANNNFRTDLDVTLTSQSDK